MDQFSPKHLVIPLGPFRIISKICKDIRGSRCTTGVVDTGGKFFSGINNTSGTPVPLIPVVCTLTCEYFRDFSKKFEIIFRGLGEDNSWKNLKQKIS
jgi:hypothetical protein